MCWETKKKELTIKVKATKNIPIFKIVYDNDETYRSIYNGFQYKLKCKYKELLDSAYWVSCIFDDYHDRYIISKGFHSYNKEKVKTIKNSSTIFVYSCDGYSLDHIYGFLNEYCKVEGFIPKGAYYHENEHGECVSDSIVLTRLIERL